MSRVTPPRDRHAVISRPWPQQPHCPGAGELCRSVGTVGTAEWMNYKSCAGQKPERDGAHRTLPLQSTVSTQDQRLGARCHDAGHGVHLGSGAAAGCCAAARICTITTTAQPRPGRGLRKFGSEQRSGIARPGATSPRAAPCRAELSPVLHLGILRILKRDPFCHIGMRD